MVGFPRQTSETAEANERDFTPAGFRDGTVSRWRTNYGEIDEGEANHCAEKDPSK